MWYIVMDVKNDYAVPTKEHICEAILVFPNKQMPHA
jgi:hypothetical protein